MIRLPPQSARCAVPIPRAGAHGGGLLPSEESASFLLWAWPRLLGWPRTINWLFSPVTGKDSYPGDLWGLDSRGELLIVETKLDRKGATQDPFEDFVAYCRQPANEKRWRADHLRRRWERLASDRSSRDSRRRGRPPFAPWKGESALITSACGPYGWSPMEPPGFVWSA